MSTTRLTFLYPHLFRSIRVSDPVASTTRVRAQAPRLQCHPVRDFATTGRRGRQSTQRHGKAVEPYLIGGGGGENGKVSTPGEIGTEAEKSKESKKTEEKAATETGKESGAQKEKPRNTESTPSSAEPLSDETQAAAELPGSTNAVQRGNKTNAEPTPLQQAAANTVDPLAPLETVLQMPPPESQDEENATRPPHLQTPPYVHHFDTYTLVQQVEAGDFTTEQSITAMKAVRGLLAHNLEVAKAGLVSKSDVENESYLFRAACSELRTEIQNQRKANEETMRRERTLLQHEVDILNQKLTQELLTLKDDLKGMFDDRKMAVRMEQRAMESKIQELNYEITVALNSDSKSEVEGLRWVLTRRSVMGILFMAIMVLTSLRYASYKTHEEQMMKKKDSSRKPEEPVADLPAEGAAEILAAN